MESSDREILMELNGRLISIEAEQARQATELASVRTEIGIFLTGLALPRIIASFKIKTLISRLQNGDK